MKKLNTKFILIFVGTLLGVFAVLTGILYLNMSLSLNRYIKVNIFSMQERVDNNLTKVFDECAYLYARIVKSENVVLLNTLAEDVPVEEKREAFDVLISAVGVSEQYFDNVSCLTEDIFLSQHEEFWLDEELANRANTKKNILVLGDNRRSDVTVAISVNNHITLFEGTFFFSLKAEALNKVCNLFEENTGYSFLMRKDGYILSHPNPIYTGKSIIYSDLYDLSKVPGYKVQKVDGVKSVVAISTTQNMNNRYGFDCYLASVLNYDAFYGEIATTNIVLISVAVALFVLSALLAVRLAKRLSAPIAALSDSITEMRKNGTKRIIMDEQEDEIDRLGKNYDEMLDRIFHMREKEKSDLEKQRKLELDALQMQINPHFLYNTLDVIAWMAKIKKQDDIAKLVLNLAGFFRLSLHKGKQFITVNEEVELVEHYLEIDKICYPEKLNAEISIEENVKNCKTLKLILQPIVENVTKYAFPEKNGFLKIRVYSEEEDIVFSVSDNGVGFVVREDLLSFKPEDGLIKGYGLYNVNERVMLEYGANYGLSIESQEGKGTTVTVRIPKRA